MRKMFKKFFTKKINEMEKHNFDDIDSKNITKEKINFLYDHCDKHLLHSLKILDNLNDKIKLILVYGFSFLAYLFSKFLTAFNTEHTFIIFLLLLMILQYSFILIYIVIGLLPESIGTRGDQPNNIIYQQFIDQSLIDIKLGVLAQMQSMIDINIVRNKKLSSVVKKSIIALLIAPFISFFLSLLLFGVLNL